MKNIRETTAYNNPFFQKCEGVRQIEYERTLAYAQNWFRVTKCFGLNAASFLRTIVEEIHVTCDSEKVAALENILQGSAAIASDDLGLFRGNETSLQSGTIHYRMFERMCRPLGDCSGGKPTTETLVLEDLISNKFANSTCGGVAIFAVVETIAWNIVDSQLPLFLATTKDGRRLFQKDNLDYVTLHLEIEGEHADESSSMVEVFLSAFPDQKDELDREITELCDTFGNFWSSIESLIFN